MERARLGRRDFLAGAGAIAAGTLACGTGAGIEMAARTAGLTADPPRPAAPVDRWDPSRFDPGDWSSVRESFLLSEDRIHLGSLYLSSHPGPVREAIASHRLGLDRDPVGYLQRHDDRLTHEALVAAGRYLDADADDIALTDSTTMGLGLLYTGLRLRPGDEILTTEHDYYVTHESVRFAAERSGATVRRIRLHGPDDRGRAGIDVDADRLAEGVARAVGPSTRVVALTWVHSGTGLKLPLADIAAAVRRGTADRPEEERPLLCVDGVHGFGVEDVGMEDLGFDFFVAGCHKWLFGPRGTGLVWGRGQQAWRQVRPTIPSFLDSSSWSAWSRGEPPPGPTTARRATPGGFKPFEHRWALGPTFDFHRDIGRERIAGRTRELAGRLKVGLIEMPNVRLITPLSERVSSGIVCFDVDGRSPEAVVGDLAARRVVATVTPYATRYVRLSPAMVNSPEEIDAAIAAVREVAA